MTPRCGSCGWNFSDRTLTKHAETPCGEESEKAGRVMSSPEVDDYASQIQNNIPEKTINDIKREEEESNA